MFKLSVFITTLVSITVLSSCTKEDNTVFISAKNPFHTKELLRAANHYYTEHDAGKSSGILILGSLEGQLVPCDCFMRPYGGLNRVRKALKKENLPFVLAGSLSYRNKKLFSKAETKTLSEFLNSHKPVAMLFDLKDEPFWANNEQLASKLPLVATNLIATATAKIKPLEYLDVEINGNKFRFFGLSSVIDSKSYSVDKELIKLKSHLNNVPEGTLPLVFMDSSIEAEFSSLTILFKSLKSKGLILIDSGNLENYAFSNYYPNYLFIQTELKSRSFARLHVVKSPSPDLPTYDISKVEKLARTWQKNLEQAVAESKEAKLFKEVKGGFELSPTSANALDWSHNSIPKETSFWPVYLETLELTDFYDK